MDSGRRSRLSRFLLVGAIALAALLTTVPVLAGVIEEEWRVYKPIELPGGLSGTGLVEVELDPDVYAHASPTLGDIRVVDVAEGREVPYKLLVESGDQRRSSVAASVRDLGHVPGKETSFVLDLQEEGAIHSEVEVQTSSENFQRRVEIEGSNDGEAWRVLEENGTVFDLTIEERRFNAKDTRVTYPASTARFLRVRIIDDGSEPLIVQGGVVFFAPRLEQRRHRLPMVISGREEDSVLKRTILFLDIGKPGFPVTEIQLDIPQRNFYRQVSVEGSHDADVWHTVQAKETLYDIDAPRFVGNDLSMGFKESRFRYYRATIDNEDNAPLPVEGAHASGFLRKLIFGAEARKTYRLYYGNPDASTPSYELDRIFPYLVTEDLPAARLGSHTENPELAVPAPPPTPFTERYPWLFPTVVATAALIIGAFLASLVRRLGGGLKPPDVNG